MAINGKNSYVYYLQESVDDVVAETERGAWRAVGALRGLRLHLPEKLGHALLQAPLLLPGGRRGLRRRRGRRRSGGVVVQA